MKLFSTFTQRLRNTLGPTSFRSESPELAEGAATALQQVRAGLPQLLAVAVVDLATGRSLASYSASPSFQAARAALHNSEVIRQKLAAIEALGLVGESLEDILITLDSQLHLLQVTADQQHFVYLAVPRDATSLAVARSVVRAAAEGFADVWDELAGVTRLQAAA